MLKTLIIVTLALGSLSLLLWLAVADRPTPQRSRREPAVSGRVVGSIRAPLAMAAFRDGDQGGGAPKKAAPDSSAPDSSAPDSSAPDSAAADTAAVPEKVTKTEAEWKAELSDMQYQVTRCSATERPFSGKYWDHHEEGTYVCVACGQELFSSDTKYDSGSGWPSYFRPVSAGAITEDEDDTLGMRRVEVRCSRCDAHLGHVFPDGPKPTGLRYCINSAALDFHPRDAGRQPAKPAAAGGR